MENHDFPTDETLAEFIEGRLDAESRQRVVEHLATCPECYDMFLTATEFAASSPEDAVRPAGGEVVRGKFGRGAWYAAAAAVAVVAVGLISFRGPIDEWSFGRRTGMASLVEAARGEQYRPVEPRFSGGFDYKKAKPVYRSGAADGPDTPWLLRSASAALQEQSETSTAKQYGAAVGEIFTGDASAGTVRLEQILLASTSKNNLRDAIAASDDRRLLSDLAAAWIVRFEGNDDLELALAAADRALTLDPRHVEAAYNRALALERLDRSDEAIEAWKTYQTMETDPLWREEAQRNIQRVEDLKSAVSPQPR